MPLRHWFPFEYCSPPTLISFVVVSGDVGSRSSSWVADTIWFISHKLRYITLSLWVRIPTPCTNMAACFLGIQNPNQMQLKLMPLHLRHRLAKHSHFDSALFNYLMAGYILFSQCRTSYLSNLAQGNLMDLANLVCFCPFSISFEISIYRHFMSNILVYCSNVKSLNSLNM